MSSHTDNPKGLHVPIQEDINALEHNTSIMKDADYCFHFAGIPSIRPSLETPTPYMLTNVLGTVRMLEAARHAQSKEIRTMLRHPLVMARPIFILHLRLPR